jgi:hypothetical protein
MTDWLQILTLPFYMKGFAILIQLAYQFIKMPRIFTLHAFQNIIWPIANHLSIITSFYINHQSVDARRWANNHFKMHLPLLLPLPVIPLPLAPPPQPPANLAAQIEAYMAATRGTDRRIEEEKKDSDEPTLLACMSKQELKLTLQMCGKHENGVKEEVPTWFLEVSAKGTQDSYKNLIIH